MSKIGSKQFIKRVIKGYFTESLKKFKNYSEIFFVTIGTGFQYRKDLKGLLTSLEIGICKSGRKTVIKLGFW